MCVFLKGVESEIRTRKCANATISRIGEMPDDLLVINLFKFSVPSNLLDPEDRLSNLVSGVCLESRQLTTGFAGF